MCSHNQLSTRLECTAQVASVIQPYIVLILTEVLKDNGLEALRKVGTIIRTEIRVRLGQIIPVYRHRSTGTPTCVWICYIVTGRDRFVL